MTTLAALTLDERTDSFVNVYRWLCVVSHERILSRRNLRFESVHPFADSLTIMDISDPDRWHIRLSGTACCARQGRDLTGYDAMQNIPEDQRTRRRALADGLFEGPKGLGMVLTETYENGAQARLQSVSLPLIGAEGERLVVQYVQVVEDIEFDFRARPVAVAASLESSEWVDLSAAVARALRMSA